MIGAVVYDRNHLQRATTLEKERVMSKVNLDALIPREDFEFSETKNPGVKKATISIEDLKQDSFFLSSLRKPDFQRETNEWDTQKISEFIESFIHGDLIPAIILWQSSSGTIFVIDGAHRLSALIAWFANDYGDGDLSKKLYNGIIPEEQIKIADDARKNIRNMIGLYSDFRLAISNPEKVKKEIVDASKTLGALAIQVQWVEGDIHKAEVSFMKINQKAAPIDATELKLLESRKKPNCIASRAIIKGGQGHKYWSNFSEENQNKIQELSKEINGILFTPKLSNPIKTLDVPIGGKQFSASTLPLILDFVNISNGKVSCSKNSIDDDSTGEFTIQYLENARRLAQRINSNHPSSLGLHPVIYFYSNEGRHKVGSFYAILYFIQALELHKKINCFIKNRRLFESVIYKNDYIIQQVVRKYRAALTAAPHVSKLLLLILDFIDEGMSEDKITENIVNNADFSYISTQKQFDSETNKSDFSTEKKSAVYIRSVINNAPKCAICGGFIHKNSISIDHIRRKQDGGTAEIDNGQLTHPFCNTGYKN